MNKKIIEYLRTFMVTLLLAFISAAGLFGWLMHTVSCEETIRRDKAENQIDYNLIDILIEKNKMLADTYPDDYRINLKLGLLYEVKNDFQNSEAQYKLAVDKAPYNEFKPQYELAKLYILTKRYTEAADLMNKISEKPKRKLILYKADIFYLLGEAYFNIDDYNSAFECYRKSLAYYKILKNSLQIKLLKNNIASTLIYIAEKEINEFKIENAITDLENALAIVKAPIIKYKLALLYIYHDPLKANRYFEEVYKEEPRIINFQTYYSLLTALAEKSYEDGEPQQGELYLYKRKKIKDFYTTNMLSTKDVDIVDIKSRIVTNNFLKKYKTAFTFKIRNISIYDINSLYLEIIVKEGQEKIHDEVREVITKSEPLRPTKYTDFINVTTNISKYRKKPEKIYVEIYASKQPNNNKILLKSFTIEEEKRTKPIWERWFLKYGLRFF